LQRETKAQLGVKINLSAYRHIAIGITEVYIKKIAAHFEKDDVMYRHNVMNGECHVTEMTQSLVGWLAALAES